LIGQRPSCTARKISAPPIGTNYAPNPARQLCSVSWSAFSYSRSAVRVLYPSWIHIFGTATCRSENSNQVPAWNCASHLNKSVWTTYIE